MRVITIGRGSQNDVNINDQCASRHHLQIIQHDDGHFSLSDFGSTNGTFVNGQKISGEISLNDMDIVRIGNTTIPWRMYFEDVDNIEVPKQDIVRDSDEKDTVSISHKKENVKIKFDKLSDFSTDEINQLLSEGARFVRFSYVISIVVMTFRRESGVYFLSKDVSASSVGWPYTLISLFLGWWGVPFGPIYTIKALVDNSEGRDVTKDVAAELNKSK